MDLVEKAMRLVNRKDFLPKAVKPFADFDTALRIGHGQTNSQPYTVQKMLEWLDVKQGQKILDVGSGSGWTTAILSNLVGPKGSIVAVEKVPQLVEFGRRNCENFGINNAKFFEAGEVIGWPQFASYDRILVSAEAKEIPKELLDQLAVGGVMVIPVGHSIMVVKKNKKLETEEYPGFIFVPLV